MQISKKHNNSNHIKTISFNRLISDLELFTGIKQNRVDLNYKLLSHEQLYADDYTYFIKI